MKRKSLTLFSVLAICSMQFAAEANTLSPEEAWAKAMATSEVNGLKG